MKTTTLCLLSMVLAWEFVFSLLNISIVASYLIVFVALWLTPKEIIQFGGFSFLSAIPDLWKIYCHTLVVSPIDMTSIVSLATIIALPMSFVVIFLGRWVIQKTLHLKERVGICMNKHG